MSTKHNLLTIGHDAKTVKGLPFGYVTAIQYHSPGKLSGKNLCPFATSACLASCLNTAGRGIFDATQKGRLRRSHLFLKDPRAYVEYLCSEIETHAKRAYSKYLIPVVRLNGTSDLPWESYGIMDRFPNIQFYDYTKNPKRMREYLAGALPTNYHLTFSRSESNEATCLEILSLGGTVTVVFHVKKGKPLPTIWKGFPVVDGDLTDLRFLDPKGSVVGLRAKGKGKQDVSGFVVTV